MYEKKAAPADSCKDGLLILQHSKCSTLSPKQDHKKCPARQATDFPASCSQWLGSKTVEMVNGEHENIDGKSWIPLRVLRCDDTCT